MTDAMQQDPNRMGYAKRGSGITHPAPDWLRPLLEEYAEFGVIYQRANTETIATQERMKHASHLFLVKGRIKANAQDKPKAGVIVLFSNCTDEKALEFARRFHSLRPNPPKGRSGTVLVKE